MPMPIYELDPVSNAESFIPKTINTGQQLDAQFSS
jgi:hypothetical protein